MAPIAVGALADHKALCAFGGSISLARWGSIDQVPEKIKTKWKAGFLGLRPVVAVARGVAGRYSEAENEEQGR